jgi:hypothetical protein
MATSTDLRSAIEEIQENLPADQPQDAAAIPAATGPGGLDLLARRLGALPWWVISAATHAVLFLLVALLATAVAPAKTDEVIIQTEVVKQKQPEYDPTKKRDIFRNLKDVQSDSQIDSPSPVVVHEKMEESDQVETANSADRGTSRGTEEAISDLPLGGTGTVGSLGVGGGGMAGVFGYRDGGGRKKAVARFGGSEVTESSVEAALRWLARHQEADGSWDPTKWDKGMGPVGMTGMAMLAFLGAGYTSKTPGKFQDNVRRAENWLINQREEIMKSKGWIKPAPGQFYSSGMYEQGMATLALAEAYGMTKDPRVQKAAQEAVDYVLTAQGAYEAWDYQHKAGKAGRNDTSVSGWNLMALKSAKIAGLKVDGSGFQGCQRWLDAAGSKTNGYTNYAAHMDKVQGGTNSNLAMASAGMLMRQFMGAPRDDEFVVAAAKLIGQDANLPEWGGDKGEKVNFYYWYYGTLCMFQMGGGHWEKWNKKIQAALVPNQCKGGPVDGSADDKDGSWDPVGGGYVPTGGRVFSTALGALTLEVYYRYLPMYAK